MAKLKKKHMTGLVLLLVVVVVAVGVYLYMKHRNSQSSKVANISSKLKNLPKTNGSCALDKHCAQNYNCQNGVCMRCDLSNLSASDLEQCTNRVSPIPTPTPKPKSNTSCMSDCDCSPGQSCSGSPGLPGSCGSDCEYDAGTPEMTCCQLRAKGGDPQTSYNTCKAQCGGDQSCVTRQCGEYLTCPNCNGGGGGNGGCYKCDPSSNNCVSFSCPPSGTDPGFKFYQGMSDCMADCRGTACDSDMDCNNNGVCKNGYCDCNSGWTGRQCDQVVKPAKLKFR